MTEDANTDLEKVRRLAYLEDDQREENRKKVDEILEQATYTLRLSCAGFREDHPSPLLFTFDFSGAEPSWTAELRNFGFNFSSSEGEFSFYLNHYGKEEGKLIFEGEHFEQGKLRGEISKLACIQEGKSYDYQIRLSLGDQTYTGCGAAQDPFFISRRQGKLSSLLEHLQYDYQGKFFPEKAQYSDLAHSGNLFSFYLTQDSSEDTEYVIIGKEAEGWKTYRS